MNDQILGVSAIILATIFGLFGIFSKRVRVSALILLTALVWLLIWYAFTAPFNR